MVPCKAWRRVSLRLALSPFCCADVDVMPQLLSELCKSLRRIKRDPDELEDQVLQDAEAEAQEEDRAYQQAEAATEEKAREVGTIVDQ